MAKEQEEKLYKHPQYGHVYGKRLKTSMGRIAWPALVKPKENSFPVPEGQTPPAPKFEVTFLFPKTSEQGILFFESMKTMKNEMVKLFNEGKKTKIAVDDDSLLKDGDAQDELKYPYYKGMWYFIAKNAKMPPLYNKDVEEITADTVIGGMKAVLIVKPICTAHGISYQLLTVQLGKDDGVRWGGGQRDAKDLLGELEEGSEDDEKQPELPVSEKAKSGKQRGGLQLDKLA